MKVIANNELRNGRGESKKNTKIWERESTIIILPPKKHSLLSMCEVLIEKNSLN